MAKAPVQKMIIPSSKVDISLAAGATAAGMKTAAATAGKLYNVPVGAIKPIPGFNVRVDNADYRAHRDMIAASIAANGFDQTKPLEGYVAKEGDENVIYLTGGHTRFDAVNALNADKDSGVEIEKLPMIVRDTVPSLTDLTVALHTGNNGRPLSPFELGVVVKRLLKEDGADKATIAKRLAVTTRTIDDVLLLVNGPKEVRTAVLEDKVSSTLAIQELRKAGDEPKKAVERITAAVEKATAVGKKKATAKDVGVKMQTVRTKVSIATGTSMKDIVKAVAANVRAAIEAAGEGDEKTAAVDGTINIAIEVPAPVVETKADAAAKAKAEKTAQLAKAGSKKAPAKKTAEATSDPAPAKKPTRTKKAAPAPAPVADTDDGNIVADDEGGDDLGIPGADLIGDDEIAIVPPAVKNGEGVDSGDDI